MDTMDAEVYKGRSRVADIEFKRLGHGYNTDQIAVGGEAVAWLLLTGEMTRDSDTKASILTVTVDLRTYGKYKIPSLLIELTFGDTNTTFKTEKLTPLELKCDQNTGYFFSYPIPSQLFDRISHINDWNILSGRANRCP